MWNRSVISLILLSFVLGTCEFIMIGIVPDISSSLGVSLTEAGMLISYFALSYAVMTPLLSIWGSRFPRYPFLLTLTALFAIGNALTLWIYSYEMLLWDRLFLASLSGVMISVSTTFAADIAPRKYLPSVMAWIFAGFSIAAVAGVPLGTLAAQILPWQWIFLMIAVIAAANLFLMACVLPRKSEKTKSVKISEEISLLKDQRILLSFFAGLCALAGNYTWYAYITPLLKETAGLPAGWLSPFLFLFGGMTIISNLASGKAAEFGGMYNLWKLLAAETMVITALFFCIRDLWAALFLTLLLGIFIYIHNASMQIYFLRISTLFHPGTTLMASALLPTAANLGISIGTAAGSITAAAAGFAYTPLPGACFMATAALSIWCLMRPERQRIHTISYDHSLSKGK